MTYYVDIDNTICRTIGSDYENSVPIPERIAKINKHFDEGHEITYWTVRGRSSGIDWHDYTYHQLKRWGCKFHFLDTKTKPQFDFIIDDRAIKIEDL